MVKIGISRLFQYWCIHGILTFYLTGFHVSILVFLCLYLVLLLVYELRIYRKEDYLRQYVQNVLYKWPLSNALFGWSQKWGSWYIKFEVHNKDLTKFVSKALYNVYCTCSISHNIFLFFCRIASGLNISLLRLKLHSSFSFKRQKSLYQTILSVRKVNCKSFFVLRFVVSCHMSIEMIKKTHIFIFYSLNMHF